MSRAVPRRVLFALLLLPLAGLLAWWSSYRTKIEIQGTDAGLRLIVNDQAVDVPGKVGHLRGFRIVPSGGLFATSAGTVRVQGPFNEREDYPMPRRLHYGATDVPYTADWWIDYGRSGPDEIIRQQTSMPEPWKLSFTFHGRGRGMVVVEGDRDLTCGFRVGGIDNDLLVQDQKGVRLGGSALHPKWRLDLRHLLQWPAAGVFMACVLILLFALSANLGRRWHWAQRRVVPWRGVIFALLFINFCLGAWVAYSILDARPHFQDDLGYLLRAKWLLAGHFSLPAPDQSDHFIIPFTMFVSDRWISMYPIGWPLLLALAQSVNAAWLAAPICGLIASFATWKIGKSTAGSVVGAMAVLLMTISPLNLMLSGSMLSHAATAMWLALFTWSFVRGWNQKDGWRSLAFAGVALGGAFSTRPLSGFSVGAIAGVYILFELVRRRFSAEAWRGTLAFAVGGLAGSLPALIDNWMTTGSPLTFAYNLAFPQVWTPRAYELGLFWVDRMVGLMPVLAFGWGWPWLADSWPLLALTFAFAAVPFIIGRATRVDWLLLGILVVLPFFYIGFSAGTGLHGFGPRYFVDNFFALTLLTARGFQELARVNDSIVRSPAPRYLAVALFVVLAASTGVSLRYRTTLYTGYNDVDARLEKALADQHVTRGLVLLDEPLYLNWIRAARLLPADVRSNLVFAASGPENEGLLRAYAGWPVYEFDARGLRAYAPDAP